MYVSFRCLFVFNIQKFDLLDNYNSLNEETKTN